MSYVCMSYVSCLNSDYFRAHFLQPCGKFLSKKKIFDTNSEDILFVLLKQKHPRLQMWSH